MPTAATVTQGGTAQGTRARGQQAPVLPVVPFVRASAEHREPAGLDVSRLLTGSDQDLGVTDIPAYGYVRNIVLVVTTSGSAGAAVFSEDGPWNVLKNIALTEPNGAPIAQFNSGYSLFLANKWGGYRDVAGSDLRQSPAYSRSAADGSFSFLIRIPVEINLRDALGSLPNQNAAATFKLRATLAGNTQVYTTPPATTQPTVRVRAFIEAWDQPSTSDAGQTNQVTPPAMNTTQFWSEQSYNYNAGFQNIRLTRVGNYVRNIICIARRTAGTRAQGDADFPDPMSLYLDARPLDTVDKLSLKHQMFERTGYGQRSGAATEGADLVPRLDAPGGLDAGVFVIDYTHEFDGSLGRETRDLWLPTLGSTRLEIQGNFASAGTLTVLTNDVAIAGGVFL